MSKRKRHALSNGVFLVGLAILYYINWWWPSILLVVWATVALRQWLAGHLFDLAITTFILIGLFLVSFFRIEWNILMPILLVVGGIYIIGREYFSEEDDEPPSA